MTVRARASACLLAATPALVLWGCGRIGFGERSGEADSGARPDGAPPVDAPAGRDAVPPLDAPPPWDAPARPDGEPPPDAGPGDAGGPDDRLIPCRPLPPPAGPTLLVTPDRAATLRDTVAAADPGTTVLLADGVYPMSRGDLTDTVEFVVHGVTLRSAGGDPRLVVLDAAGGPEPTLLIQASDVVIADITLLHAGDHSVRIEGASGADAAGATLHNVRIVDPGGYGLRIQGRGGYFSDAGRVECSVFELTDEGRASGPCRTRGGIRMFGARGWRIRGNVFRGMWCGSDNSRGLLVIGRSADTLIEANLFEHNQIAMDVGEVEAPRGTEREDADRPCGPAFFDNLGGVVCNNLVVAAPGTPLDDAITVAQSCNTFVAHNTVVFLPGTTSRSAIAWRFAGTNGVEVLNNLSTHGWSSRDGATVRQGGNVTVGVELATVFRDPTVGDFRLAPGPLNPAVGAGVPLVPVSCTRDVDGELRGPTPDSGFDEIP